LRRSRMRSLTRSYQPADELGLTRFRSLQDASGGAGPLAGTGVRFLPVEHEGRTQVSPEEVDVARVLCHEMQVAVPRKSAIPEVKSATNS